MAEGAGKAGEMRRAGREGYSLLTARLNMGRAALASTSCVQKLLREALREVGRVDGSLRTYSTAGL